jgi:hypothetical protein
MEDETWVKVLDVEEVPLYMDVECARKVGRRHLWARVSHFQSIDTIDMFKQHWTVPGRVREAKRCSAKTTKPPYSSLSILSLVLEVLIVRSDTALVAEP